MTNTLFYNDLRISDSRIGKKISYFYKNRLYIYNNLSYIDNMKARNIYNRIAVLRQERNIARKELAEEIGVNFQTVGYLEREEYNPSLDLAFRFAEVFGLPIDLIFSTEPLKPLSQELLDRNRGKEM